jgi:AcrR family transcriptional regulator
VVREPKSTLAGERTRERILEAALPLFAEFGFAGTSVRMVAAEAAVNVATLAYHFEDKAGLYGAVVQRLHQEMASLPVQAMLEADQDPIRAIVLSMWRFAEARREHIRLLHRHLIDAGTLPDVVVEQWVDVLMEEVKPLLSAIRPDWSETERRILVFATTHLIVRFVLEDRHQLARLLQIEGDPGQVIPNWIADLVKLRLNG